LSDIAKQGSLYLGGRNFGRRLSRNGEKRMGKYFWQDRTATGEKPVPDPTSDAIEAATDQVGSVGVAKWVIAGIQVLAALGILSEEDESFVALALLVSAGVSWVTIAWAQHVLAMLVTIARNTVPR
jgi:hypothetical protein